jgi:hypothetical protein
MFHSTKLYFVSIFHECGNVRNVPYGADGPDSGGDAKYLRCQHSLHFTLSVAALYSSYLILCILLLWRRVTRSMHHTPPDILHDPAKL